LRLLGHLPASSNGCERDEDDDKEAQHPNEP
jgi:hypothetical protein